MIEVENTDVNIVRNLIPMRNLMPSERLWSESHFRLVEQHKCLNASCLLVGASEVNFNPNSKIDVTDSWNLKIITIISIIFAMSPNYRIFLISHFSGLWGTGYILPLRYASRFSI